MTDVRLLRLPVYQLEAVRFARYGTIVQAGDVDADNLIRSPGAGQPSSTGTAPARTGS